AVGGAVARRLAVAVPAAGGPGVPALPVGAVRLGPSAVLQAVPAAVGHARHAHHPLPRRHRMPPAGARTAGGGRGADLFVVAAWHSGGVHVVLAGERLLPEGEPPRHAGDLPGAVRELEAARPRW